MIKINVYFIKLIRMTENLKLNPWNKKNKLLSKEDVYKIYTKAGFHNTNNIIIINNLQLYQQAFVHSSYSLKNNENIDIINKPANAIDLFDDNYENMEFLGDRCLDLSVAYYLYRMYPDTDQGFKTKMKTKI